LFRDSEAEMRRNMIDSDVVEAVIGLGPNLFYNSPMEACLLITNNNKPAHKKGKILIINAVKDVKQEKSISFLEKEHIDKIYAAYKKFEPIDGYAVVVDKEEVLARKASLNIAQYVSNVESKSDEISLDTALENWEKASDVLSQSMNALLGTK